ncbi:biotin-dependent 3-methylcrotonyl-coenzyme A carboxylase beta1 subunit-like [Phascolarctos cinereus]|uniref:methylcrotonoyl-CoA carboxylase n=1 Tax=Phascolarctos cinereus TaxID=38626 RepID=A0A6P5KSP3_PHACI|nr:methylcrotonoyl-CoA carboxylase beta chain, mitochondrial-like [Phascolarctos cinereus]XP_020848732.1 methylcrotonoyl-CoA carboxylase beta chain, mitochondrial-like [Phascolarctos cinereus]XP_020848733.1 methylcrotonoyl-CoA carboxylase beta chain, mitochondrial-like [Phascolarctos cinereus]
MWMCILQKKPFLYVNIHLFPRLARDHTCNLMAQRRNKTSVLENSWMLCTTQFRGMADGATSSGSKSRKSKRNWSFPVLDGSIHPEQTDSIEANLRNSEACIQRYLELLGKVCQREERNILRHTRDNRKLLVRDRLRLVLDNDEDFFELSPLAGYDLPYGTIANAGCLTGIGKICGVWCMLLANDATVKGGTLYPITVKKQLRAQHIAIMNRLPTVYLVDSGGAFLPLQAEIFPDQCHGGRVFYNIVLMSSMKIPQVAVVCGSCIAGAAYYPSLADESIIIDNIGSLFLAGPPLVKAATGEDISVEELGGATVHSRLSGGVDYLTSTEEEAYECVRNVVMTFNCGQCPEDSVEYDEPLYSPEELKHLAPKNYECSLDVKLILSRLIDGSRFQEFKAEYGTTLVTGFAHVKGHLIGLVANNGELTYQASLKGSNFVNLCSHRNIPILFLLNTVPKTSQCTSLAQAEDLGRRFKAQACMMATIACAEVPKITLVIGGCFGNDSYAMCGRSFDPNFLFLWPNARVALVDCRSLFADFLEEDENFYMDKSTLKNLEKKLENESTAFYSSARLWDDGVILPQNSREVIAKCLAIIKQKESQTLTHQQQPILRM